MSTAADFLRTWHADVGTYSLGAIAPDGSDKEWLTTRDLAEVEAFVERNAAREFNLYFQPNVVRPDLGTRRADKKDVAGGVVAHAEIDPPDEVRTPAALEEWQTRRGAELTDPKWWSTRGLPHPTAVVFSGSGFVVLFRLEAPVKMWHQVDGGWTQDLAAVEFVEARNRKLVELLGADPASTDISRLLRLPGTVNYPAASKLEKGRVGPEAAVVLELTDARVSAGLLPASAPKSSGGEARPLADFAGLPSNESLLAAIEALGNAWPSSRRHQAQLALAGALARMSWPAEHIAAFLYEVCEIQQPGNGLLEKRLITATRTVGMVERGENVAGWPSLEGHVGAEALDVACRALGVPRAAAGAPEVLEFCADAAAAAIAAAPAISPIDVESRLKEVQRKLAGRKDADAIRDAEFLRRVLKSEFLSEPTDDDGVRRATLARAAVAVARSVPPGTTAEQVEKIMLASSGSLAADLAEVVPKAMAHAAACQDITAKASKPARSNAAAAAEGVDELVVETQGKRAGRPDVTAQHNVRVCLRRLGVALRYNEFADHEVIERDGRPAEVVQDHHVKHIRAEMESLYDFRPEKENLFDLIEVISRESSYHPIKDYLATVADVPSDGTLTERWLIDYAGAPDTPYVRAVSRLLLCAAVRRVRRPGCKFDEMVILESTVQGKSKSTALRALCADEEWFSDDFTLQGNDTKKMMESTGGKWIIEAGELRGMSNGDHNVMKAYLSRRVDRARMAYGRKTREIKRQFVIVGTTNDEQYLRDATGNRRYWPIRVQEFDVAGLLAIRDALWAEACRLEEAHPADEYIRLDPSLYAAAAAEQEKRRVDDPIRVMVEEALGSATGMVRMQEAWRIVGHQEGSPPSSREQGALAAAMQSLGWTSERRAVGSAAPCKYYVRGDGAERDVVLKLDGLAGTGWRLVPVGTASPAGNGVVPQAHPPGDAGADGN